MASLIFFIKVVIIGIVEGITEFLPISSTGHMVLAGALIHFRGDYATLFEIVIQFGAILAVIVLFRRKIGASFRHLKPGQFGFRLWMGVIAALIPTGIVAFLFRHAVKNLMTPMVVASALVVGGIVMIIMENMFRGNNKTRRAEDVSFKQGFVIGIFQCLSFLWPGFSRSASTIMGGWAVGLSTFAAAEFTFFLAIPTMFAASGYSLLDSGIKLTGMEAGGLIVGFLVAFVVALIVVKKFIEYLKSKPLRVFAIYRIIVGMLILVLALTKVVAL